jgi:dihydroorotase
VLSIAPARIGRVDGHGIPLTAGAPAEIVLIDPSARRAFGTTELHGKSTNSPYLGVSLPGRVVWTFHEGAPTVADGVLLDAELVAARSGGARG